MAGRHLPAYYRPPHRASPPRCTQQTSLAACAALSLVTCSRRRRSVARRAERQGGTEVAEAAAD